MAENQGSPHNSRGPAARPAMPLTYPYGRTAPTGGPDAPRPFSTGTVLVGGFAIVFALWVAWGFELTRSLQRVESNVAEIQDIYVRGEQTLSKVRTNVLLGSIYLRDAVIGYGSVSRDEYLGELGRLRHEVNQALEAYLPEVNSVVEREHWEDLSIALDRFWESRDIPFTGWTTPGEASALLHTQVVPQRETVLTILDELGALQTAANERRQADAGASQQGSRLRLLALGGATLLMALVVATAASRQVGRLQHEIERQRTAERQNRRDLERLSARLVDVQEQERRTIARELHDEVGQALTAVKMDIGIALRSGNEGRVRGALEEARDLTEATLRGVRDLSQLLHPSILDDFGLPATLATYLRSFSQRTGIHAHLAETIEDRLAPAAEVCVYRIVQEALNNVAQHSAATSCAVTLRAGAGTLQLVIDDNGGGFRQTSPLATPGLGLIGMRERAHALGGTFRISTHAGGGARIEVTLPRQAAQEPRTMDLEPHAETA